MFRNRTLLLIVSALLVLFILAIVISPYVDLPESGLRAQALLLVFFSAIVGALNLCLGLIVQPSLTILFQQDSADCPVPHQSSVLLC